MATIRLDIGGAAVRAAQRQREADQRRQARANAAAPRPTSAVTPSSPVSAAVARLGLGQTPRSIGNRPAQTERPATSGDRHGGANPRNLPRGMRNNNPLNIESGDFTRGQQGYRGSDGRFARFATFEQGMTAAHNLITNRGYRERRTIRGVVSRWAPRGDGANNPDAYAGSVARQLGLNPDTVLNFDDRRLMSQVLVAMSNVENGTRYPVDRMPDPGLGTLTWAGSGGSGGSGRSSASAGVAGAPETRAMPRARGFRPWESGSVSRDSTQGSSMAGQQGERPAVIQIEDEGRIFSVPTLVNGQQHEPDEAEALYRLGLNTPTAQHDSMEEALAAQETSVNPSQSRGLRLPSMTPDLPTDQRGEVVADQSGSVLEPQYDVAREALGRVGLQLQQSRQVMEETHAGRMDNLEGRNNLFQKVNERQTQALAELDRQVQPLMAERQQITDRLRERRQGNPLINAIRGIFDLNYNEEYQERQLAGVGQEIEATSANYQMIADIQNQMLTIGQRGYQMNEDIFNLAVTMNDEQLIAAQRDMDWASAAIDINLGELQAGQQLLTARIRGREEFIDGLAPDELSTMLQAANESETGSITTADGHEIRGQHLAERLTNLESREIAFEQQQLALSAQHAGLQEDATRRIVQGMTQNEIQSARANGGVFNGVEIPMAMLNAQQTTLAEGEALQLGQAVGNASAEMYRSGTRQMAVNVRQQITRAQSMFGANMPPSVLAAGRQLAAQIRQITGEAAAAGPGAGSTRWQYANQQLAAAYENYTQQVETAVANQVGGNEEMASAYNNFLFNGDMSPAAANDVLVRGISSGTLPSRMGMDPGVQALATEIRGERTRIRDQASSRGITLTEDALNDRIAGMFDSDRVANITNSAAVQFVSANVSTIAREMGHPFQRVTQDEVNRAEEQSRQDAIGVVARESEMSPRDAMRIAVQGPAAGNRQEQQLFDSYVANQTQAFFTRLNDISAATSPTFRPSDAYVDLIESPRFRQRATVAANAASQVNFGSYLANQAGSNQIGASMSTYSRGVSGAYTRWNLRRQEDRNTGVFGLGFGGMPRAQVVTRATASLIDGFSESQTAAFGDYVYNLAARQTQQQNISNSPGPGDGGYLGINTSNRSSSQPIDETIERLILTGPFEDTTMEQLRRRAARDWPEASRRIRSINASSGAQ